MHHRVESQIGRPSSHRLGKVLRDLHLVIVSLRDTSWLEDGSNFEQWLLITEQLESAAIALLLPPLCSSFLLHLLSQVRFTGPTVCRSVSPCTRKMRQTLQLHDSLSDRLEIDCRQSLSRQEVQQVGESEEAHTVLPQFTLGPIVHVSLEPKLLQCLIGVHNLLWLVQVTPQMVLFGGWLVRCLTLLLSEVFEYLLNTIGKALLDSSGVLLYLVGDFLTSSLLSGKEAIQFEYAIIGFQCVLPHVYNSQLSDHFDALGSMSLEDILENLVSLEELFFKCFLDLISFVLEDVSSPHPDDLPLLEILEEVLIGQLLVVPSVLDPLM